MEELKFEFDITEEEIPVLIEEVIKTEKIVRKGKVPKNYINNADFIEALIKYKIDCADAKLKGNPKPRIPNYIGDCFMKLSEGLSRRPNFFGYTYRDEMVADGIENCLMYFENFDPETKNSRGFVNAFGYFTKILWWCFVRRIQKEKKQQYIKYKATENFGVLDTAELMELGEGQIKQLEVYDNMYEYIKEFENKEFNKIKPLSVKKPKISGIEKFLEE